MCGSDFWGRGKLSLLHVQHGNLASSELTKYIFFGGGGVRGNYNSVFVPVRGTEQQVKINGQVGL